MKISNTDRCGQGRLDAPTSGRPAAVEPYVSAKVKWHGEKGEALTQDLRLERLERLSRLRGSGALTQAEFEAEKATILAGEDADDWRETSGGSRGWWAAGALLGIALLAGLAWSLFGDEERREDRQPQADRPSQPAAAVSPKAMQSPPPPEAPDPLGIVSRQWLIGGWIPSGQNCASDGGVIYNSDGTYMSLGQVGTWKLEGTTLVTLENEHMNDDGEWEKLAHPVRSTERFTIAKQDEYRTVDDKGGRYHNLRCKDANVR